MGVWFMHSGVNWMRIMGYDLESPPLWGDCQPVLNEGLTMRVLSWNIPLNPWLS